MTSDAHGPVRGIIESVEDLSPTFRRIVFSGPQLDDLAVDGPVYDQRIKLILPNDAGQLPQVPTVQDWYQQWLTIPDAERGVMRTYSVRELTRDQTGTYLTVDFVLHFAEDGSTGPAAAWAAAAKVGDALLLVAPRKGVPSAGIEFAPGNAAEVVLLGDEAAAPAIARIIEDLHHADTTPRVAAYIEVPQDADHLRINGAANCQINWLTRGPAELGEPLAAALGWHIQDETNPAEADPGDETLLWETPVFSATGEALDGAEEPESGTYYWIAGESGVIKRLRRFLVREVGVARSQVAFMGYWRDGVAMRG